VVLALFKIQENQKRDNSPEVVIKDILLTLAIERAENSLLINKPKTPQRYDVINIILYDISLFCIFNLVFAELF